MKLFKFLIIPTLLIFGYLILLSYPYFFSKINRYDSLGPLSLVEEKSIDIQKTLSPQRTINQFDNNLLKGEEIAGTVKADENNFGIFLVRFARLSAKVSDTVVFRIKEKDASNWYYENIYKANQFQPDQYFTFGFPSILNSKNKTYIFEIQSLSGTYKNGVGLSSKKPQFALVYKYHLNNLRNYRLLFSFLSKKFIYIMDNINFLQNWQILATFFSSLLIMIMLEKKKINLSGALLFLSVLKKNPPEKLIYKIKYNYKYYEIKLWRNAKNLEHWFISTKFYLIFLNTNWKKRLIISSLIFLLAFIYRFSSSLTDQSSLFYYSLGGQGDYDQFIRAATCAVTNFCSAILGQNFLLEASVLGIFYKFFGFTEALKVYLYLMIILSSIVAVLPYLLLSRKNWISLGGILGSLFLATSDFLTHVALNFPPDNGSLFTFSMFFIVYLLTLQKGTTRWLIFFGLMGTLDGLNKALFLINDLAAFALFIPVLFYDKVKEASGSIFRKKNIKILFLSSLPLFVFLIIYIGWEYFVYIKFSAVYFLRGLLETGGKNYIEYTPINDTSLGGGIISGLFYLFVSAIIMLKRLIEYTDLQTVFLAPIFLGLLFFSFIKVPQKEIVKKFILMSILSILLIILFTLIKNDYFKVNEIFNGDYIYTWTEQIYVEIFLLFEIIILFILNFKYSAIKLSLPIIPYVIMLVILTKNSPFPRISTQVVAWIIILLAYLFDWGMTNIKKYSTAEVRLMLGSFIFILFILVYALPKMLNMATQLNSGFAASRSEIRYLRWVKENLPANAIILAGGKSDLVTVAENLKRPIVFNTLWSAAVLIRPNAIPQVSPTDFTIISELRNKNNFKKNKYIILEDDIYLWRDRVEGIADNVFAISSKTLLQGDNYSIKVYKFNPTLKKAIYELDIL